MVDYYLNGDYQTEDDGNGGFRLVDGKEEFEQEVIVRLREEQRDILQNGFSDTAREKIRLAINRTAQSFDLINQIRNINISRPIDKPSTFAVEVTFVTGGNFQETF